MLNLKLEILNLRLISGTKVKSRVLEVKKTDRKNKVKKRNKRVIKQSLIN